MKYYMVIGDLLNINSIYFKILGKIGEILNFKGKSNALNFSQNNNTWNHYLFELTLSD